MSTSAKSPQRPPRLLLPTSRDDCSKFEQYHNAFLHKTHQGLKAAVLAREKAGIRAINVSAAHGKFMSLLARSIGAIRIVEVGMLAGVQVIGNMVRKGSSRDGEVITLEFNAKHAEVAQQNIAKAGFASSVKTEDNNAAYFEIARKLVRTSGVIIVDNVMRHGRISDPNDTSSDAQDVRKLLEIVRDDPGVDATTPATVGDKGWDGFLHAYVL